MGSCVARWLALTSATGVASAAAVRRSAQTRRLVPLRNRRGFGDGLDLWNRYKMRRRLQVERVFDRRRQLVTGAGSAIGPSSATGAWYAGVSTTGAKYGGTSKWGWLSTGGGNSATSADSAMWSGLGRLARRPRASRPPAQVQRRRSRTAAMATRARGRATEHGASKRLRDWPGLDGVNSTTGAGSRGAASDAASTEPQEAPRREPPLPRRAASRRPRQLPRLRMSIPTPQPQPAAARAATPARWRQRSTSATASLTGTGTVPATVVRSISVSSSWYWTSSCLD